MMSVIVNRVYGLRSWPMMYRHIVVVIVVGWPAKQIKGFAFAVGGHGQISEKCYARLPVFYILNKHRLSYINRRAETTS